MSTPRTIRSKRHLEEVLSHVPGWNMETVCSLIGHSRICTTCFGYRYCGRCGVQVGDNLMSVDPGREAAVIIGHNCQTCRENYKRLTWRDKAYTPDPFVKEEAA